jgi:hypothetical protein
MAVPNILRGIDRVQTQVDLRDYHPIANNSIQQACVMKDNTKLLIQDIKGSFTLNDYLTTLTIEEENVELPNILYLVYLTLNLLVNQYTHYDLHTSNVLLYRPSRDKMIEYHYNGLTFYSPFIVKIIDYGRCYIPDSPGLYQEFKAEPLCKERVPVGPQSLRVRYVPGFAFNRSHDDFYGIASNMINQSHDLRLMVECSKRHQYISTNPLYPFGRVLAKAVSNYGMPGINRNNRAFSFGTLPKPDGHPVSLRTVSDAEKFIRQFIVSNPRAGPAPDVYGRMTIHDLQTELEFIVL